MSDDGEELEFGVALGARAGGQDDEGLGAVLGVEGFAVDVDAAEFARDAVATGTYGQVLAMFSSFES